MQSNDSTEPLHLSFPAILQNPRLKHLARPQQSKSSPSQPSDHSRLQGRRRQQRNENANFASNPHVTRPTHADYFPSPSVSQPTFPVPPPPQFAISLLAPGREPIEFDPPSAAMGSFNRPLKGIRKNIRKLVVGPRSIASSTHNQAGGGRVEEIIKIIDERLSAWIQMGVVWMPEELNTGLNCIRILDPTPYPAPGHLPRATLAVNSDPQPTIVEVSRSPHRLCWNVPDPFARYLVHSLARYYGIVSISRHLPRPSQSPQQVVWMIRAHLPTPQGSRVDGRRLLDTPPTTDIGSELSDAPSNTDDEHDPSLSPVPPAHPLPSTPAPLPTLKPDQPKTPSRVIESDDGSNSSRCGSETDEIDYHLSDSGFPPPKPLISSSELTPLAKPNRLRTPSSVTPRQPTYAPQTSHTSSVTPTRINPQQQPQQPRNAKAQITTYAVPKKTFLQWIWADT